MASSDTSGTVVLDFGAHLLPTADEEDPTYRDIAVAHERFTAGGVDGAVLSWSRYIGSDDVEGTRRANDTLLEVIEGRESYYGLAALPSGAGGEAAAREFERCLDAGWNGGAIETSANGIRATDGEMEPVYEVADDAGAPLLLHPKVHDSLGPGVLDDDYLLNSVFGREVALCETVWRLIHDGFLDRYPDFTPVVHHSGGNIATMLGRVRVKMPGDPPEGLKSADEFEAQLRERVYLDTSGYGGDPVVLGPALDVFSASNVMLGSDYPYEARTGEDFRAIIAGIESVASPDEVDRILGGNALDVLVNVD